MMAEINQPYQLIFVYDNGDQFTAGKYLTLKDAIQAKNRCKDEIGKRQVCGRVLETITILKGDADE
jgi:hypothetical protein